MTNIESLWQFSKKFDQSRKKLLEEIGSYQNIVKRIQDEATVTWFDVCEGEDQEVKKCVRPEFKLKVHEETFDLFFNSPYGYRAQYLIDPEEGRTQNDKLINELSHKLLAYAQDKKTRFSMTRNQIDRSLSCPSARIWISEENFLDYSLIKDILVPEWCKHATDAYDAYTEKWTVSKIEEKQIWGVRAPVGTILVVIGAFLDDDGEEVVNPEKVDRHLEIQRYGFT